MQLLLGVAVPRTVCSRCAGCSTGVCLSSTGIEKSVFSVIKIMDSQNVKLSSTEYSYTSTGITMLIDKSTEMMEITYTTFDLN